MDQFYSEQEGILGTAPEVWRQYYVLDSGNAGFPRDYEASANPSDIGIWSFAAHFGWVWSRARECVFECAQNKLTEPWRLDSIYAKCGQDMTEIENKVRLHHPVIDALMIDT